MQPAHHYRLVVLDQPMRGEGRQVAEREGYDERPPGRQRRDRHAEAEDADAGRRIMRRARSATRMVPQVKRPEFRETHRHIPQKKLRNQSKRERPPQQAPSEIPTAIPTGWQVTILIEPVAEIGRELRATAPGNPACAWRGKLRSPHDSRRSRPRGRARPAPRPRAAVDRGDDASCACAGGARWARPR